MRTPSAVSIGKPGESAGHAVKRCDRLLGLAVALVLVGLSGGADIAPAAPEFAVALNYRHRHARAPLRWMRFRAIRAASAEPRVQNDSNWWSGLKPMPSP